MNRLFSFLPLLLFVAGCVPRSDVELTQRQKDHLIQISRQTLVKHVRKGMVTPQECEYAKHNPPEFRAHYRGYRYGSAVILWRTPGRLLEFHYEDDLTAKYPVCSFATRVIPREERRIQPDKSIPGR